MGKGRRGVALAVLAAALLTWGGTPVALGAPALLEAQGMLRDAQGTPVTGEIEAALSLHAGPEGEVVWSAQQPLSAEQGRFRVVLGDDPRNPLPVGAFTGPEQLWLGVQPAGELPLGRVPWLSVPFALDALLAATATASALSCPGCVGPAALALAVAGLAELATLDEGVAAAEAIAEALGGPTLGSLPCGEGQSPLSDGDRWICSGDLVAADELAALARDSVEGLAGGTVQGDVHSPAVAAGQMRQGNELVCDASGNCGATVAGLSCGPDQVLRFVGLRWECDDFTPPPAPPVCAGERRALQWDGAQWRCVELPASGRSEGAANGLEVRDAWGYVWDGLERAPSTWQAAHATCATTGGRLPTPSELYRNNASSGTGNLSTLRASNALWTAITNYRGRPVTVRLSDGAVADATEDSGLHYRCVWPDHRSAAFDGDACFGPPGQGCVSARRFYHLDRDARPAMDYVAAGHECNFFNASLPTVADWTSMIHAGEAGEGDYNWLWAAGAMYHTGSPYFLMPLVRFDPETRPVFSFTRAGAHEELGGWSWPHSDRQAFRCMGKRSADEGVDPAPECQGGCFGVVGSAQQSLDRPGRRAPIWADSVDRAATTQALAQRDCAAVGGALPTVNEMAELLHAGWANGTNAWLWTRSPLYVDGHYRYALGRWTGAGPRSWYATSGNTSSDGERGEQAYRCVWHQTVGAELPSCPPGTGPTWDGESWGCAPLRAGDDGGLGTEGGWQDPWSNAWDAADRPAARREGAAAICTQLGARLPTATELHRVRGRGPASAPEPSSEPLWTSLPSHRRGYGLLLRLDTAVASEECLVGDECLPHAYRCVWPVSGTNTFGGAACADLPGGDGASCHQARHWRWDGADRATIPVAAAATECARLGGSLAALPELEEAIRSGLPRGDFNAWSMVQEPIYDGDFLTLSARWGGDENPDWFFNSTVTGTAGVRHRATEYDTFRCSVSSVLR